MSESEKSESESEESEVDDGGHIQHIKDLSTELIKLYSKPDREYSDVTFIVEGKEFHVHKNILSARSLYFKALFQKDQTKKIINFDDAAADSFGSILSYIYSGELYLSNLEKKTVLHILKAAHKLSLFGLEKSVFLYLNSNFDKENIFDILNLAISLGLTELIAKCEEFCDSNCEILLRDPKFQTFCPETVLRLIKRDSFYIKEEIIFNVVSRYIKTTNVDKETIKLLLKEIRLPLLDPIFLLENVKNSGFYSSESIIEAMHSYHKSSIKELKYRGMAIKNKNLVSVEEGFQKLLKGQDIQGIDGGYYHKKDEYIALVLKKIYIVDYIELLLCYKNERKYKYKLEVSADNKYWAMIADNSQKWCSQVQKLNFLERPVKFIKITGLNVSDSTYSTLNLMEILRLEIYLKRIPIINLAPPKNAESQNQIGQAGISNTTSTDIPTNKRKNPEIGINVSISYKSPLLNSLKKVSLIIDPEDTIKTLKNKFAEKENIQMVENSKFSYLHHILEDNHTVSYYKIQNNSNLSYIILTPRKE